MLLQNEGFLEEAVQHADRARQLQPSAEYTHLTASVCRLWAGRPAEAERTLREGLAQVPEAPMLQATLALARLDQGQGVACLETLAPLAGRWGPGHPLTVLLAGAREEVEGHRAAMVQRGGDQSPGQRVIVVTAGEQQNFRQPAGLHRLGGDAQPFGQKQPLGAAVFLFFQ